MKLYFLRHGAAEDRSHDSSDFARRLTPAGTDEMKRVAEGLAALIEEVDFIISSPLPRALETAAIAAPALRLTAKDVRVADELRAGAFGLAELVGLLRPLSADSRVMLVGHEPDFSSVVMELTGGSIEMKKAGLAFVDVSRLERGGGVLRWLLTARHLQLAARE